MTSELTEIQDCLATPGKLRVLMMLDKHGPMTAKQMMAAGIGVSQTTLYRLLKNMEESGVLQVVEENRVRAITEKTYDVRQQLKRVEANIVESNDVEAYCRLFNGFAFNLQKEFEDYSGREGGNILDDGPCYAAMSLFATADEIDSLMRTIREAIGPYMTRRSDDQQMHTFAVVVTPPCRPEEEE